MDNPCQLCLIKNCCSQLCEQRIIFSIKFYREHGAHSKELRQIWHENWIIFKTKWNDIDDGLEFYKEFLESMQASIDMLKKNENCEKSCKKIIGDE
jgi:hypothetical protein